MLITNEHSWCKIVELFNLVACKNTVPKVRGVAPVVWMGVAPLAFPIG